MIHLVYKEKKFESIAINTFLKYLHFYLNTFLLIIQYVFINTFQNKYLYHYLTSFCNLILLKSTLYKTGHFNYYTTLSLI